MNLPLNIPQILPVADAIQLLEGTTEVYVRLLLTRPEPPASETGSLVVRSLVVDVLPTAWDRRDIRRGQTLQRCHCPPVA